MNNISKKLKTLSITALLLCTTGVSQTAYAEIGLPDTPLFLGTTTPPNIFFGLDDSNSMALGFLVKGVTSGRYKLGVARNPLYRIPYPVDQNPGAADGPIPSEEFLKRVMNEPTTDDIYTVTRKAQATSDLAEVWRAWTFAHNRMFYNPATTYIAWPSGKDSDGLRYTNAKPKAARIDPYQPADETVDLTSPYPDYTTGWNGRVWDDKCCIDDICNKNACMGDSEGLIDGFHPAMYYAWKDTNVTTPGNANNKIVDADDVHLKVEIKPATATYSTDSVLTDGLTDGLTDRGGRSDCVAAPLCSYAEEIQNFANWFSYYRTREYVMKRAISDLIDDSASRMGLATLNDHRNNNNGVGTAITDMTIQANKDSLLKKLFQVNSDGSTPLLKLMRNIGRYFDDTNNNSHSGLGFTDASPILSEAEGGECQQNFAVLLTDGFWNDNLPLLGADNSDDNADGDGDTDYDGGPHADEHAGTLADRAMYYYERDLSSLANHVKKVDYIDPSTGIIYTDNNPQQHLTTYGVSFGLSGTGLTTPINHKKGTAAPPWTDPINNTDEERLDDLQHAAFNGRGLFLNANDPETLIDSLNAALADIDQRNSVSASEIAINSTVLKTTSLIFQASFNSVDWIGELSAFSLNTDGSVNAEKWVATDKYSTVTDPDQRNIFTSVSTGGIKFDDNPANPELNMAIGTLTVGATTYTADNIIHYISGDQTHERVGTDNLRKRAEILGDIVNSSPISIGFQDLGYDTLPGQEGTDYGIFLATKDKKFTGSGNPETVVGNPETVVYVGANDGMLHAFHDSQAAASEGRELFAYIPGSLHGKLGELADPAYGHKFYVNGNHSVGDACIGDGNGSTCVWKTILVGTLGEGGRTVYALDVTDPFSFNEDNVLWEYNFDDVDAADAAGKANSAAMGFIKGAPQIVRLNNGAWGVVFGNGYNSENHQSQIFILNAKDGTEIKVFNTNIGNAANENGMATPLIIDKNDDRIADTIYSGDLFGNLFKFDISDMSENDWGTMLEATGLQPGDAKPLYRALDGKNEPQAITTKPTIAVNPEGGFNIIFGTGKYIENSDTRVLTPYQVETMYSIWDDDNNTSQVRGRSDLQEQTIDEETNVTVGTEVLTTRIVSETTIDYSANNPVKGWYMDALAPALTATTAEGERIIADPLTRSGRAIFTTFIPPATPCDVGGESVLMELDALSGARLEDSVFDINGDGIIDDKDFVTGSSGNRVPVSGIYVPGTLTSPAVISLSDPNQEAKQFFGIDGETTTVLESTGGQTQTVGRQSWKQIE